MAQSEVTSSTVTLVSQNLYLAQTSSAQHIIHCHRLLIFSPKCNWAAELIEKTPIAFSAIPICCVQDYLVFLFMVQLIKTF